MFIVFKPCGFAFSYWERRGKVTSGDSDIAIVDRGLIQVDGGRWTVDGLWRTVDSGRWTVDGGRNVVDGYEVLGYGGKTVVK